MQAERNMQNLLQYKSELDACYATHKSELDCKAEHDATVERLVEINNEVDIIKEMYDAAVNEAVRLAGATHELKTLYDAAKEQATATRRQLEAKWGHDHSKRAAKILLTEVLRDEFSLDPENIPATFSAAAATAEATASASTKVISAVSDRC